MDSAHKSHWEIAEVVFGIPFLPGILLHFILPLSLSQGILRQALLPMGMVLIFTGIWLVVLARREFARYHQPTDPGQPTDKVIKTGVFSKSRNPLYLACVLILSGVTLAMNSVWVLITLLISIILCHYILIIPEEKYLAAKFGGEYTEYASMVGRWLGRG